MAASLLLTELTQIPDGPLSGDSSCAATVVLAIAIRLVRNNSTSDNDNDNNYNYEYYD